MLFLAYIYDFMLDSSIARRRGKFEKSAGCEGIQAFKEPERE
jgi:hypothetical protein